MDKIFVSYSHKDKVIAREIVTLLSEAYDNVWYDEKIQPGINWRNEIKQRIVECDHFIFLVSRESLESEVCRWEIQIAHEHKHHIIPVLIRGSIDERETISAHQMLNMTDGLTIRNINRLYATLIRRQLQNLYRRDVLDQLRNSLYPDLMDIDDTPLGFNGTAGGYDDFDETQEVPVIKQPSLKVVPKQTAQATVRLPSFIKHLNAWDEEPWMIFTNLHGKDRAVFASLSESEQRRIYDAFQKMLRMAHEFVEEYENLFEIVNTYLPDMGQNTEARAGRSARVIGSD